ncbi:MAG TPA: hypothetical protein VI259_08885 [Gemmatimonadaceae bacterium]
MQHRHEPATVFLAWTMAFASAPAPLHAAAWETIPAFSGTIVIESDTLAPSTQVAGASGVWVRYTPALSVDCSPPRGCYAHGQRIHYNFGCAPRYAIVVERISMDLNGAVLKHETPGHYAAVNDEAANRIFKEYCRAWDRD